jgi:hypothetical protein
MDQLISALIKFGLGPVIIIACHKPSASCANTSAA